MPSTARCFVVPALLMLIQGSTPASAQVQTNLRAWGSIPLDSGAMLRITRRDGSVAQGRLFTQSSDGITVTRTDTNPLRAAITLPSADISAVEVGTVSRQGKKGAVVGLIVGASVGLVGALSSCSTYSGPAGENFCSLGVVIGPPFFGTLGAIAGALVGSLVREEAWRPVPPLGS